MTKKNRLTIFIICGVLFFILTPYIILYSLGYRINFTERKIIATGGIYVKVLPNGADIIIDSRIKDKTSLFSNNIFVQNLLPEDHNVLIKKEGYYDYQKNLLVKEKEVTKLENVILFKNIYNYSSLEKNIDYFSIAPDNSTLLESKITNSKIDFTISNLDNDKNQTVSLSISKGIILDTKWSQDSKKALIKINSNYFIIDLSDTEKPKISPLNYLAQSKLSNFNPQNSSQIFYIKNKNLYVSSNQNKAVLNNIASYKIVNQNIIWLSYDGFLYNSSITGTNTNKITSKEISVQTTESYSVIDVADRILVRSNNSLLLLDENTKELEVIGQKLSNISISPNNQRLLYFSDNMASYFGQSINLNNERVNEKIDNFNNIQDCQWINDDYIVCSLSDKIVVSEIDTRGNVNVIDLAKTIKLNDENIIINNADIFFNQRDKKLYILTNGNLLVSEKLIP